MSEEKKQQANPVIVYIGEDSKYLDNVKARYKKNFASLKFDFESINEPEDAKIQSLVQTIYDIEPTILFLDFAKHTEEMLHLARISVRLNSNKDMVIIGLLDQKASLKTIKEAYLTGVSICHIKSGEIHDVVYDSIAVAFPDKAPEHGFASCKLDDHTNIFELARIGYLNGNTIHLECNRPLSSGAVVALNTHWYEEKIVLSMRFAVNSRSDEGLFYDFKHALEMEFMFVDPYEPVEDDDEDYIAQKKAEDEEKIDEVMANIDKWMETNMESSHPKLIRALVIDKELKIYSNSDKTDQYSFVIRSQPYLLAPEEELKRIAPQIIFYELNENEVGDPTPENNKGVLKKIIAASRDIKDYEPFFIILNSDSGETEALRGEMNYSNIICHNSKVTTDIVVQMTKMLEAKIYAKYKPNHEHGPVVYLKKNHPASLAELMFDIRIKQLSETDMIFESAVPISFGTTFRLAIPANMFITVIPKAELDAGTFYALIHGISESEKMRLRKFINSVFFREKEAAKSAEKQDFEDKKAEFKKKEEEERLKREEEERKKQEEEEKRKKEEEEAKKAAMEAGKADNQDEASE